MASKLSRTRRLPFGLTSTSGRGGITTTPLTCSKWGRKPHMLQAVPSSSPPAGGLQCLWPAQQQRFLLLVPVTPRATEVALAVVLVS